MLSKCVIPQSPPWIHIVIDVSQDFLSGAKQTLSVFSSLWYLFPPYIHIDAFGSFCNLSRRNSHHSKTMLHF